MFSTDKVLPQETEEAAVVLEAGLAAKDAYFGFRKNTFRRFKNLYSKRNVRTILTKTEGKKEKVSAAEQNGCAEFR